MFGIWLWLSSESGLLCWMHRAGLLDGAPKSSSSGHAPASLHSTLADRSRVAVVVQTVLGTRIVGCPIDGAHALNTITWPPLREDFHVLAPQSTPQQISKAKSTTMVLSLLILGELGRFMCMFPSISPLLHLLNQLHSNMSKPTRDIPGHALGKGIPGSKNRHGAVADSGTFERVKRTLEKSFHDSVSRFACRSNKHDKIPTALAFSVKLRNAPSSSPLPKLVVLGALKLYVLSPSPSRRPHGGAETAGSWEGHIRIWKLDAKLNSFALIGTVPASGVINSLQLLSPPKESSRMPSGCPPPSQLRSEKHCIYIDYGHLREWYNRDTHCSVWRSAGELELEILPPRTTRKPISDFEPMDTLPTAEQIIQPELRLFGTSSGFFSIGSPN
ncbi:hypothetical protein B0H14DRAFT_2659483 [Mycena olivaceomarginata]|nr:hypothetical protein B0H14DRAFT_2659483 [Mycena olivaceomarginata]